MSASYSLGNIPHLEQFLQHVVAEDVCHEEVGRGDDLIEDQLFVHIGTDLPGEEKESE